MMKWWGWGDPKITFPMADKPNLWPWIAKKLGVVSTAPTAAPVDLTSIQMPPTRASTELLAELYQVLRPEQITVDPLERLLHTYGKSFPDLFRVRNAVIRRAPDAVVFPDSHAQVEALVHTINRGGSALPRVTASKQPIFRRRMPASSKMRTRRRRR
jgi:alkyldihydroxyacetonephosphate synthase